MKYHLNVDCICVRGHQKYYFPNRKQFELALYLRMFDIESVWNPQKSNADNLVCMNHKQDILEFGIVFTNSIHNWILNKLPHK